MKAFVAFAMTVGVASVAAADANDPWPVIFQAVEANGCKISEAQIFDVLIAEGVSDLSNLNAMVLNFGKTEGITYDAATGMYAVSGTGNC